MPKFLLDTKLFFNDYYNVMNKNNLSREYLESISTADLISLADYYGIDIPENLNRRFIIGDLLEVAEEIQDKEENEENVIIAKGEVELPENLPKSYNETKIRAVLHNPAWAFVYWDTRSNLQGENGNGTAGRCCSGREQYPLRDRYPRDLCRSAGCGTGLHSAAVP